MRSMSYHRTLHLEVVEGGIDAVCCSTTDLPQPIDYRLGRCIRLKDGVSTCMFDPSARGGRLRKGHDTKGDASDCERKEQNVGGRGARPRRHEIWKVRSRPRPTSAKLQEHRAPAPKRCARDHKGTPRNATRHQNNIEVLYGSSIVQNIPSTLLFKVRA